MRWLALLLLVPVLAAQPLTLETEPAVVYGPETWKTPAPAELNQDNLERLTVDWENYLGARLDMNVVVTRDGQRPAATWEWTATVSDGRISIPAVVREQTPGLLRVIADIDGSEAESMPPLSPGTWTLRVQAEDGGPQGWGSHIFDVPLRSEVRIGGETLWPYPEASLPGFLEADAGDSIATAGPFAPGVIALTIGTGFAFQNATIDAWARVPGTFPDLQDWATWRVANVTTDEAGLATAFVGLDDLRSRGAVPGMVVLAVSAGLTVTPVGWLVSELPVSMVQYAVSGESIQLGYSGAGGTGTVWRVRDGIMIDQNPLVPGNNQWQAIVPAEPVRTGLQHTLIASLRNAQGTLLGFHSADRGIAAAIDAGALEAGRTGHVKATFTNVGTFPVTFTATPTFGATPLEPRELTVEGGAEVTASWQVTPGRAGEFPVVVAVEGADLGGSVSAPLTVTTPAKTTPWPGVLLPLAWALLRKR